MTKNNFFQQISAGNAENVGKVRVMRGRGTVLKRNNFIMKEVILKFVHMTDVLNDGIFNFA